MALVAVAIPAWSEATNREAQAKAVFQARQIGLALKIFAADNDGNYPKDRVPTALHAPATSNAAFAPLLPAYIATEKIFGNPLSAYQTHPPDDVMDGAYTGKQTKTLEPGENVYAYVMGLDDNFNPACPLVVDGTDGTGHYGIDPKKRGGVWEGEAAVVIHLDLSAGMEALTGNADARYVPLGTRAEALGGRPEDNLLDVSRYGASVRLLEPAVGADK